MTSTSNSINDTIVAQVTPPGRSGVGIVRVSGIKAYKVAEIILGKKPKPRYAEYLSFVDTKGVVLDKGIALWFSKPDSFTGEDVLELQGHGGPIILDLLMKNILKIPDIRIANPGEFSKRAFLNNKLDLTQVEAIADLIGATSEQAARYAMKSLQGNFSDHINRLSEDIDSMRTYIEAVINFPEDEIVDFISNSKMKIQLDKIILNLKKICVEAKHSFILQEGMKIVIAGLPNVGKSSLLNTLAGREVAIVTNIMGTTRDVLSEYIQIDGIPLYVVDTAGLRNTNDEVERIGIKLALQEIEQADHLLFMINDEIINSTTKKIINLKKILPNYLSKVPKNIPITIVSNKIDITGELPGIDNSTLCDYPLIRISTRTGEGLDILRLHIKKCIGYDASTESSFLARRRHLQILKKVAHHLRLGKVHLIEAKAIELFAEELRIARQNLDEITGKFTSDNLLNRIFSSFCIGK